ncbi:MAG: hypothetical protein EXS69_02345 [Candidatus Zambryskibacteria bacterium]|nr:hypothetical protein [Candidatus Zambryskibacteria bacterium]
MIKYYKKLDGWPAITIGTLVLVGATAYGTYSYNNLQKENFNILSQLEEVREGNVDLALLVREREGIIDSFDSQIGSIKNTVGNLEKLNQTDKELLKKYSKVYFLNENFAPPKLVDLDKEYIYNGTVNSEVHAQVYPYLERLIRRASVDGTRLLVASAYRSFGTQSALKSNYKVLYGSGANQFSADQGYSEHQLGTAIDFTTPDSGAALLQPIDPAYKWLQDHAYEYGFILSYPAGNSYYKFEPWHWRFVGIALAKSLTNENKYFYDLDQREIDNYLINIFD